MAKRPRDELEGDVSVGQAQASEESSSDDDLGPALPSAAPAKKKRKLPYEKLYLAALPTSARYSRSLMHREPLSYVTVTPRTDFLITTSVEGVVKFWKKGNVGIEFVKEFNAHKGEIRSVAVSPDGRTFVTAGVDRTIKIFDVVAFDLLAMIDLDFTPGPICWISRASSSVPLVIVGDADGPAIRIFDGRGDNLPPIETLDKIHRSPLSALAYNLAWDCVVSADMSGMVEYWTPTGTHDKPEGVFEYKSSTSLFEFKKAKSHPTAITISPRGNTFATFSFPDRRVRLFEFATAKLQRTYDESLSTLMEMQQAGTALRKLEEVEFGRRLAAERTLDEPRLQPRANIVFDESGHFLLYGSLHGVKVINTHTNRVVRVYGQDEPFRPLHLALYQGAPQRKGVVTAQMAASSNPLLQEAEERDPILIATGSGKVRFYMFTNDDTVSKAERDVHNEKPRQVDLAPSAAAANSAMAGNSATLHTTYGDIQIRLFPDAAPKAVENFVTHARNGYYNNTIFHRVIRKFMIQGGDPLGDGTGGESIWGREFADEISSLKHDKPYTVSMANAGPNTNASQFFITTEKAPWLDGKHTIFGRAVQGLDVVHRIENARLYKEKPEEDIKIVSITVS